VANGPAIWGGCVTRRKHRPKSRYPVPSTREGQKAVTVQACLADTSQTGRVRRGFCHPGTSFDRSWACRGIMLIDEVKLSEYNRCYKKALAQCRGTSYLEARKLSRYRNLIAGRCGYPGTRFSRIYLRSRVLQKL